MLYREWNLGVSIYKCIIKLKLDFRFLKVESICIILLSIVYGIFGYIPIIKLIKEGRKERERENLVISIIIKSLKQFSPDKQLA